MLVISFENLTDLIMFVNACIPSMLAALPVHCNQAQGHYQHHILLYIQASLKRKWEEVGEEKTEAIKVQVKTDLDVKEMEELAKADAKTQAKALTLT